MVQSTADTYRATAEVSIRRGGSMRVNDAHSCQLAELAVKELFGAQALIPFAPLMVSEKF